MAVSQAAYAAEKAIGHQDDTITAQDITNYNDPKHGDPSKTMKAVTWQGKNSVAVKDVARPKIIEDRDVIVRVTGSTVCGSDLHLLHGAIAQMAKGDILGHEFCGIVDEVGPGVKKIKVGTRAVASFNIACGECYFCKQKLSSQCERTNANTTAKAMYGNQTSGIFGYSHFTGGFGGGQAEYVRVPLGDVNLLEIPDDVPDEKALYLSDVLVTSCNAVKDTAVYEGDAVAIWGAGPIGQMAGAFALQDGARKIIFVDTEPRLSFIKERWPSAHLDKLELIDYKQLSHGVTDKPTVVSRLRDLTDGRGVDVALECAAGEYAKSWTQWLEIQFGAQTDTCEIINEMIESVRSFGRCGITGVYVGYTNHFNIGSLMERGVRLIGNGQAPVHRYWHDVLGKIQAGDLDVYQMLSHRVRLEDLDKVYGSFDKRQMQKVFVQTKSSFPRAPGTPELTTF